MNRRQLALVVWCAAAACLPVVVSALRPAVPARIVSRVERHPSLAAQPPLAVEIGTVYIGPVARAPSGRGAPIWMRGARLTGVAEDPKPLVVAQKSPVPPEASSAHAN